MKSTLEQRSGFTLIELSIVLVIIGLIVGGVLVGRDLIRASQLRKMVSEVEEFKTAANTFRLKYGQLPGDMHVTVTPQWGFFTFTGLGSGVQWANNDGLMDNPLENYCIWEGSAFFYHLAQANLIKMSSSNALDTGSAIPLGEDQSTPYTLSNYLPESKVGGAFFCTSHLDRSNFFRVIAGIQLKQNVFTLRGLANAATESQMTPSLSPIDLYSIDKKIDDGVPLKGKVMNTTEDIYNSNYPWNAVATNGACVFGGATYTATTQAYNAVPATGGNLITCQPVFVW